MGSVKISKEVRKAKCPKMYISLSARTVSLSVRPASHWYVEGVEGGRGGKGGNQTPTFATSAREVIVVGHIYRAGYQPKVPTLEFVLVRVVSCS